MHFQIHFNPNRLILCTQLVHYFIDVVCIHQFQPDLVLVSAGYDAAIGCPEVRLTNLYEDSSTQNFGPSFNSTSRLALYTN